MMNSHNTQLYRWCFRRDSDPSKGQGIQSVYFPGNGEDSQWAYINRARNFVLQECGIHRRKDNPSLVKGQRVGRVFQLATHESSEGRYNQWDTMTH